MKDVKDRNEQFEKIDAIRKEATNVGLPIISIDTRKKEMPGNFKREGKALSTGRLKSLDHDFATFSDGQDEDVRPPFAYGAGRAHPEKRIDRIQQSL